MLFGSAVISFWVLLNFQKVNVVSAEGFNMDKGVAEFVEKWLPLNHKPHLSDNKVFIMADLYNIIDLNEVAETITTKLWFYIAYILDIPEDDWNTMLPGVYEFFPGTTKIWKPDVIILNKVQTLAVSGGDPIVMKYICCSEEDSWCGYCGTLVVFPAARTEVTTCSIDVVNFPFDYQNCVISIGPWFTDFSTTARVVIDEIEYGPYRIEVVEEATNMSLISYEENSAWELMAAPVVNKTRIAKHNIEKEFEVLEYTLKLRRKPEFFIYTLILPCFALACLAVLSVLVPVESGEKIGLGVTVLLAQIVNLLILTSFVPASSQYFPFIGIYVLVTILLISTCLIYNALIINFYYHGYQGLINFIANVFRRVVPRKGRVSPNASESQLPPNSPGSKGPGPKKESQIGMEEKAGISRQDATGSNQPEEEEELRKKRCIVADHVFSLIILLAVIIVHLRFFVPYM